MKNGARGPVFRYWWRGRDGLALRAVKTAIRLHFSLSSIWEARRDILGLGPAQIVLCGLAFGGIALGLGFGTELAVLFGGAMALSSTAVVVQVLAENGQHNCPVGTTGTAVLVFQDTCAILLLMLAASLYAEARPPARSRPSAPLSAWRFFRPLARSWPRC